MNKQALKALTARHGETLTDLAHVLGITENRLADKISGHNREDFTLNDIAETRKHYHLSAEQVELVFFQ